MDGDQSTGMQHYAQPSTEMNMLRVASVVTQQRAALRGHIAEAEQDYMDNTTSLAETKYPDTCFQWNMGLMNKTEPFIDNSPGADIVLVDTKTELPTTNYPFDCPDVDMSRQDSSVGITGTDKMDYMEITTKEEDVTGNQVQSNGGMDVIKKPKRNRTAVTAKMKKEVCEYKQDNPKAKLTELHKHFSKKWGVVIGQTTFSDILRNRQKWLTISTNFNDTVKFKTVKCKDLEDALYQWLEKGRTQNKHVSCKMMLRKARLIGKEMNVTDLAYSNSWLARFKKRYSVRPFKKHIETTSTCVLGQNINVENRLAQNSKDIIVSQENKEEQHTITANNTELPSSLVDNKGQHVPPSTDSEDDDDDDDYSDVSPKKKRNRVALTPRMKKVICQYKDDHPKASRSQMVKHFKETWGIKVGLSTIHDTLRDREKWFSVSDDFGDSSRLKSGKHKDMEESLFKWFNDVRSRDELVSTDKLLRKAKQIGKEMNITDLAYSNGWLAGFKRRHVIVWCKTERTLLCRGSKDLNWGQHYVPKPRRPQQQYDDINMYAEIIANEVSLEYVAETGGSGVILNDENISSTGNTNHTEVTDANKTCSTACSLEEARLSLVKVITFLEYHPKVRPTYINTLLSLLKYFNGCPTSSRHQTSDQVVTDIVQVKQEDLYTSLMEVGDNEEIVSHGMTEEAWNAIPGISTDAGYEVDSKDNILSITIHHENLNPSVNYNRLLTNKDEGGEQLSTVDAQDITGKNKPDLVSTVSDSSLPASHITVSSPACKISKRKTAKHKPVNSSKRARKVLREDRFRKFIKVVDGNMSYDCMFCSKSFCMYQRCRRHVMLVHSGERPFKCNICDKTFAEKGSLKKHDQIHSGKNKTVLCTICGKHLAGGLEAHMRYHSGEKPFKCPHCGRHFGQSSGLTEHIRTHTGEKPYTCETCGMTFAHTSDFRTHKLVHTGERPYVCQLCGARFSRWITRRNHMRGHTGEKPFTCSVCQLSFSLKVLLKNHTRVHTGEKPYSCKICKRKFSHSGSLYHHMKMHRK